MEKSFIPVKKGNVLSGFIAKAWRYYLFILIAIVSFTFSECSANKATGERQFNFISEGQEIEMGKQSDEQIVASMGLYPDEALQNYVSQIGKDMAAKSERPSLPWTFRVLDDPLVNAFALPGGYIYVTRGILSHLNNEAELAGVLGHEIGHVTAKHSVEKLSKAQILQLGVGAAMIFKPELQKYGELANLGLSLMFLKFGRDDEKQADDLGLRYMQHVNADPAKLPAVMDMLDRVTKNSGGGGMPEWLSTHPNPANRRERLLEQIEKDNLSGGVVDQEEYLSKINGIVFGQNPREGFFRGTTFYHPELKFTYQFPNNWQTVNQKQAVIGISKDQDAIIQITLSPQKSAQNAARELFSQQGIQSTGVDSRSINGLNAASGTFSAKTEQGEIAGVAAFVEHANYVYQIIGYTGRQNWNKNQNSFANSIGTFKQLNDPNLLKVEPMTIEIVTLDSDMTAEQFAQKYSPKIPVEKILLINNLEKGSKLKAGAKLKSVKGENFDPQS